MRDGGFVDTWEPLLRCIGCFYMGLLLHAGGLNSDLCCPAQLMLACAYCVQHCAICLLLRRMSCLQCKYMQCWHGFSAAQEPAILKPPWADHPELLMHAVHG